MSSYFERSLDLHVCLKHSYVIRVQQRVELHHELSQPPSWEHRVICKRPETPNGTKTPIRSCVHTLMWPCSAAYQTAPYIPISSTSAEGIPSISVTLLWASVPKWPWASVWRQAASEGSATGMSSHSTDRWSYLAEERKNTKYRMRRSGETSMW